MRQPEGVANIFYGIRVGEEWASLGAEGIANSNIGVQERNQSDWKCYLQSRSNLVNCHLQHQNIIGGELACVAKRVSSKVETIKWIKMFIITLFHEQVLLLYERHTNNW